MSSKTHFAVYGYENFMSSNSVILLEEHLGPHQELVYISFMEDIVPKYLIVLVNNT